MDKYMLIDSILITVCAFCYYIKRNDTLLFVLFSMIFSTIFINLYNYYIGSYLQLMFRANLYLLIIAIFIKFDRRPVKLVLSSTIAYTVLSITVFIMIYLFSKDILNGFLTIDFMTKLAFSYSVLTVIMLAFQITVGVLRGGSNNCHYDDSKRDCGNTALSDSNGL